MNAAIYLRKSRAEENAGVEETLKKHRTLLLEHAARHDIHIVHIYEEVISGESLYTRPQMLMMLEAVEEGRYDAILCVDLDRLGRGGMRDQGIILEAFKQSGTKIITPDKTYDLSDEMDEELTEFKTFMSRRELKIINKRLRRGLRQTIEQGGYIANAPYGYEKTVQDKKPTLKINEEEAHFVQMIFDLYTNRGMGCTAIADTINALGARPHRAEKFGRTSVLHILKNPTYVGQVVWDRTRHIKKGSRGNEKHITQRQPREQWVVTEGLHPPIIHLEQFDRAQQILAGRSVPPSNTGEVKNPLAGLVQCGVCGATMQRSGSNRTPYLLCPTKDCVAGTKFHLVEEHLLLHLQLLLTDLELTLSLPHSSQSAVAATLDLIERELATGQQQLQRLYTFLEQGVYDVETFQSRRSALSARQEELRELQARYTPKADPKAGNGPLSLLDEVQTFLQLYNLCSARGRNLLLSSVVDIIIYNKPKKSGQNEFSLEIRLKK